MLGSDRIANAETGASGDLARASNATVEEAVDLLAQRLHWKFAAIDPCDETGDWAQLDEHQRDIYRAGIRAVLQYRDLIKVCLT